MYGKHNLYEKTMPPMYKSPSNQRLIKHSRTEENIYWN